MRTCESIWDERSSLERLIHMLPGFRGYHIAENRREADRLFRSFGRARLDRVRAELEERSRERPRKERGPYRGIVKRLQRLCQRLSEESHPGFRSPLMSIPSRYLDPIYCRDEDVVRGIVALAVATGERRTEPQAVSRELDRIERALDERHHWIDRLLD